METMSKRIPVGISACTYGCRVRWNMKGWDFVSYFGRETEQFTWFPVCPECSAGLGVPRSPIRIVGESGAAVWDGTGRVMSRENDDVTEALKQACVQSAELLKNAGVHSYIFMEGSPSCGVYRTTLKNKRMGKPPGVFGALLQQEGFFLIPALDLQSPVKRWDWRRRLMAFEWLQRQQITDTKQLYDMWHKLKFLCQELDEPEARELGNRLAGLTRFTAEDWPPICRQIGDILRKPSTIERIRNRLWKHYIYYRKKSGKSLDIKMPDQMRGMGAVANELMLLERASYQDEVLFGAVPVRFQRK